MSTVTAERLVASYRGSRRPPLVGARRIPFEVLPAVAGVVALHLLVLTGELAAVRAAVGLPVVMLVPGALALRILGDRRRGADRLLHVVALSLAVLILVGTGCAVLPGVLTPVGCLLGLDVALALLLLGVAVRRAASGPGVDPDPPAGSPGLRGLGGFAAVLGIAAGVGAVALAVAGAHRLNDHGGPALTMAALGLAALGLVAAVTAARHRRSDAAAAILYLLGAAVLLATSLRGTGVTGHDVKIEYRVLMDTLDAGRWQPGGWYAAYNSCLSLTTLPAFLTRLLGVDPLDVFRVCFQLVAAVLPVGAFLVARRLLPAAYAVLSAGLFIAFPTFVNDLPMLNRQELALVFFVVLLLSLFDVRGPRWRRITLLLVAAAGLTVSHYSSAAVAAALLGVAWVLRLGRRALTRRRPAGPALPGLGWVTTVLVVLLVGWAVGTSSAATFLQTLSVAARAVGDGALVLSDSSRYNPIGADAPVDDAAALRAYTDELARLRGGGDLPVPAACRPVLLPADSLATTAGGATVAGWGVSPRTLNTVLRQGFVGLFELGAVVGCLVLWWRLRRAHRVPRAATRVAAELSAAGVILLGLSLVAPQVTDSYGLLRLYQQLLPILGVSVVVALVAGLRLVLRPRRLRRVVEVAAVAAVVACLVTTSGLLPRLTGGYPPQLNLSNAGPYYRAYYVGGDERAAAEGIAAVVAPTALVVADSRDTADLRAYTSLHPDEGLVPGTVPPQANLVVTTRNARTAVATAVFGDRVIRYTFPLTCVTAGRTLLRSADGNRLYSPVRPAPARR